jgi:hypothetical protein
VLQRENPRLGLGVYLSGRALAKHVQGSGLYPSITKKIKIKTEKTQAKQDERLHWKLVLKSNSTRESRLHLQGLVV